MNYSPTAARISNWLRFERCAPAWKHEIEAALGITLTPALIKEGEVTGLFRLAKWTLGEGFF